MLVPLAIVMLVGFIVRGVDFTEAAQTATAGLITLIPEGLVLLMSVTLAVAARPAGADGHARPADERDRGAGRRRHDLRRQDRDAHRRHLELISSSRRRSRPSARSAERTLGRFAASAGERNRTLETIAEAFPAAGRCRSSPRSPSPRSGSGAG